MIVMIFYDKTLTDHNDHNDLRSLVFWSTERYAVAFVLLRGLSKPCIIINPQKKRGR